MDCNTSTAMDKLMMPVKSESLVESIDMTNATAKDSVRLLSTVSTIAAHSWEFHCHALMAIAAIPQLSVPPHAYA